MLYDPNYMVHLVLKVGLPSACCWPEAIHCMQAPEYSELQPYACDQLSMSLVLAVLLGDRIGSYTSF